MGSRNVNLAAAQTGGVCFVTLENIMMVPYFKKYRGLISREYDVIYWDRRGLNEDVGAREHYALHSAMPDGGSKFRKLAGYLRFRRFAKAILSKNKYDRVVLLSANTSVLLGDILLRKYRGKYLVDIRDYWKEENKLYYTLEKRVIGGSGLAAISSPAFRRFLPEHAYIQVHNTPDLSPERLERFFEKRREAMQRREEKRIVLSYIGGVRFFEQDRRVLDYFANDPRFFVRYFGAGAELLRPHCEERGIKNVYLHGLFPPEQALDFYEDTDYILNLYGNHSPLVDYLLSNRLYYALYLEIPILVCPDTFMEEFSAGAGIGVTVDLDDPRCKDSLIAHYQELDRSTLHTGCTLCLAQIQQDNERFDKAVRDFLRTR